MIKKLEDSDILDFVEKYNINNLSWKAIALHFEVDNKTVRQRFKKLGITKNPVIIKKPLLKSYIEELIKEGLSQKEIAQKLNKTTRQVTQLTNRLGLKNNNRKQKHIELTKEQFQVLLGSVLGDGHFDKHGRVSITHCCKQFPYLYYKTTLLDNLFSSISKERFSNTKFKNRPISLKINCSSTIKTICCDSIMDFRKKWYPNNKRILNKEDFYKIEPLGLAVWVMDDGYKTRNGLYICTDSFNLEDVYIMRNILLEKFNILFQVNEKYRRLYLLKSEFIKFYKIVLPFFIPEMLYKLQNVTFLKNEVNSRNGEIPNLEPLLTGM